MSKLLVIDRQEYVLEGEFERLRAPERTIIDEENVIQTIEEYKQNFVNEGLALGTLNEGFLVIPTDDGEQVYEEEKDPAFMIIDIYWNRDRSSICGKLIILDTEDGEVIKAAINQGVDCFMSSSETETYEEMNKETGRILYKIANIKGYRLSLFNFHSTI
jgi:hypothetical protein